MRISESLELKYIGMALGNPHAVIFMDENPAMAEEYGKVTSDGCAEDRKQAYESMDLRPAGMTFQRSPDDSDPPVLHLGFPESRDIEDGI